MAIPAMSHRWTRASLGLAISGAFLAVTLTRVDLRLMTQAWADVTPALVLLSAALSFFEVAIRAARWRILLRPLANPGYAATLGFISIGHLANAVLPARLGDVARALLAGSRMKVSRASVLGTIAVERVADVALLGVAATAGVMFGYASLAGAVLVLIACGIAVATLFGVSTLVLRSRAAATTRVGVLLLYHGRRFVAGTTSLRDPKLVMGIVLLTVSSFGLAVLIMQVVGGAVGLSVPVAQAAVIVAAVTLSTAIPAGPASVGTYEFVGMTVMTSMGFPAEASLLTIAVVHVVATLTPALMGVIAMSNMGIGPITSRFGTRIESHPPERGGEIRSRLRH